MAQFLTAVDIQGLLISSSRINSAQRIWIPRTSAVARLSHIARGVSNRSTQLDGSDRAKIRYHINWQESVQFSNYIKLRS